MTCPADLLPLLESLGLSGDVQATPMTGGVSSDIQLVTAGRRTVVAKRALAQLRVAAHWEAPVERSASEAAWLAYAADAVPGCCPRLLAYDDDTGWLVMEHLDPATHPLWKAQLLGGTVDPAVAAALGTRLGKLHDAASATPGLAATFATDELFEALRLDPYLRSLLPVHPQVETALTRVIETTRTTKRSLVHGDVSPKNVLVGPEGPVLLDAETAWWGDPAFDVAFLLNHLVLKAVHHPHDAAALVAAAFAFLAAYTAEVRLEPADDVLARAADLLPALALARVDGKSPVEYLDVHAQATVRDRALRLLIGRRNLAETVDALATGSA